MKLNKKGQDDISFILSVIVFQTFVILALGFLDVEVETQGVNNTFFDFGNVITNISILGWGNTLLFAPILICILYIGVKLLRGTG